MPSPDRTHDALTAVVVTAFLLALAGALAGSPGPILGSLWGVGVALLVLVGTLVVGYALMQSGR